ncbi:hypothetical protein C8J56DRAFT_1064032 [Mycena floridula]|nr:hypothetical protein C8J56DRAFT_1064032 [Mycena floridula]
MSIASPGFIGESTEPSRISGLQPSKNSDKFQQADLCLAITVGGFGRLGALPRLSGRGDSGGESDGRHARHIQTSEASFTQPQMLHAIQFYLAHQDTEILSNFNELESFGVINCPYDPESAIQSCLDSCPNLQECVFLGRYKILNGKPQPMTGPCRMETLFRIGRFYL